MKKHFLILLFLKTSFLFGSVFCENETTQMSITAKMYIPRGQFQGWRIPLPLRKVKIQKNGVTHIYKIASEWQGRSKEYISTHNKDGEEGVQLVYGNHFGRLVQVKLTWPDSTEETFAACKGDIDWEDQGFSP